MRSYEDLWCMNRPTEGKGGPGGGRERMKNHYHEASSSDGTLSYGRVYEGRQIMRRSLWCIGESDHRPFDYQRSWENIFLNFSTLSRHIPFLHYSIKSQSHKGAGELPCFLHIPAAVPSTDVDINQGGFSMSR
jgi:hypothetical protein